MHQSIYGKLADVNTQFLAFSKLLTNDSNEHRQSVSKNRPSIARCMAGCSFCRILVDLYTVHINHTILSIFVYIFTSQSQ